MSRVTLLVLLSVCALRCDHPPTVLGTWEYRQENLAAGSGFDDEGETLVLEEVSGELTGRYFGLEREGEHGLFYTATPVSRLVVDGNFISFVVPGRKFYAVRPRSLQAAAALEGTGGTLGELRYAGYLSKGRLVLQCVSTDGRCPGDEIILERAKW